jgi:hypothetical protein
MPVVDRTGRSIPEDNAIPWLKFFDFNLDLIEM